MFLSAEETGEAEEGVLVQEVSGGQGEEYSGKKEENPRKH